MFARRTTVLLLLPGRRTVSLELDPRWPLALAGLLMLPLMIGATARRCLDLEREGRGPVLALSEATGSLHSLYFVRAERVPHAVLAAPHQPPALMPAELRNAWLRVDALHLGEALRVRPFDDRGLANPQAFDALGHLMRCRVTGEEVAIDPRLVRILVQLSATYDRPIQLVSGHRHANVIGTHPTSQHTLGKAADIRVAGIDIEALRARALELGARGVGLYPEKDFVHIDVRDKPKYTWKYTEDGGEEQDMR
ncbi:MAG: YcbK family protein [Polyangiales bacterium]